MSEQPIIEFATKEGQEYFDYLETLNKRDLYKLWDDTMEQIRKEKEERQWEQKYGKV